MEKNRVSKTHLLGGPLESSHNTVLDLVQVLQEQVKISTAKSCDSSANTLRGILNKQSFEYFELGILWSILSSPALPWSSQSIGWVRWCQVQSTRSS